MIAELVGISPKFAARVVAVATGIQDPFLSDDDLDEFVDNVRGVSALVVSESKNAMEQVSLEVGADYETVERIIKALIHFRLKKRHDREQNGFQPQSFNEAFGYQVTPANAGA
ncbi:MAG: hypothetical protein M9924_14830 [Rhizobiaceae bacterium]|nr:hypothetical protein [Rhizobiaceae bacterium]